MHRTNQRLLERGPALPTSFRRACRPNLLAAALLFVLAWGCASAPPKVEGTREWDPTVEDAEPEPWVLGPSDLLLVTVFGHPEHSSPPQGLRLDPEGNLDLPLLGPVALAGLELDEARDLLTEELSAYLKDPRVSITVQEAAGMRIYLLGHLNRPGSYPLDRPLTAMQALSLGGGFATGADHESIALLRRKGDDLVVHYFNAATPGPDGLVPVRSGDVLFIRRHGGGVFQEQIRPFLQGYAGPIASLATLLIAADRVRE